MVLMTLLPFRLLQRVRPVAAADYFLRNRLLAWFALRIIGVLPIQRGHGSPGADPLAPLVEALDRGEILIFFPEGTRGEPERLKERRLAVPVIPVFLHGVGKALPKGEAILVPFFVDVFVGEEVPWTGDPESYLVSLRQSIEALAAEGHFPPWE
jgi:1-acyl-sn-glycerol-3-phosphate acyltransferase